MKIRSSDPRWKLSAEPPEGFDPKKYREALNSAVGNTNAAMYGAHEGWEKVQPNLPYLVKALNAMGAAVQALGLDAKGVFAARNDVRKLSVTE